MRTTKIGTLVILGVLGVATFGCGDTDADLDAGTASAEQSPTTTAPERSTLVDELVGLGVDVDAAPIAVVDDTGASVCGTVDARTTTATIAPATDASNSASMQCLASHAADGTDADLIEVFTTVEGDPIVVVWRTSRGTTTMHTDSTRDAFGSGDWSMQTCASVSLAALDSSNGASGSLLCN